MRSSNSSIKMLNTTMDDSRNHRLSYGSDIMSDCDSPASYISSSTAVKQINLQPTLPSPPFHGGCIQSIRPDITVSGGSLTCILMSVMSPCSTETGRKNFIEKLKSLRELVDSDSDIFIVDCGRSRQPIDNTEFVIYSQVSDQIHYVYFPENHRVLSLYWTSKYWIPFLFASNMCGDYIYTLITDETISFPKNFNLPPDEYLLKNG